MLRLAAILLLTLLPALAHAQGEQQTLVDRATLTVEEMLGQPPDQQRTNTLRQSKAVMICPRIFRAGFFFGGAGGDCVLVARDGAGSWSAPAFYTIGSASFGLQIGIQDAEVIFMVLTERGLNALLDSQFKLGGDASVSFATAGVGVEGATTAALRADILAFAQSRGLYAGITLGGSLFSVKSEWNQAYYGQPYGARQIVIQMTANNPGANPLRAMLARYGSAQKVPMPDAAAPQEPLAQTPPATAAPAARAPVQQESLPTPLQPAR